MCEASLVAQWLKKKKKKNFPMQETQVQSLGWKHCLEKEMAIHFSILLQTNPWTEKPGSL